MLTKRQEAELIISIQGKGEVPLKFNYLGSGAEKWHTIAKSRISEGINYIESNLISKRASDFLESFDGIKKINVIDIGCGDGSSALPILAELKKHEIDFQYVPLDISEEMLEIAEKTIKENYAGSKIKKVLLDFELGNFSEITYNLKSDNSSNLLLFLGSTVGNFSDTNRVLTNMRDSMSSDDFLIVGVEMTNFSRINKIIPHYTNKIVEDLVCTIPFDIGIKKEDIEYEAIWNDKESQVEMWMLFNKDQKVKVGSESFVLEKDERLLLARSIKFNEWTFTKLISDVGFRTELLTTSRDRSYVLSMIQPTRYSV